MAKVDDTQPEPHLVGAEAVTGKPLDARHQEMLLVRKAGNLRERSEVAVILQRRLQPIGDRVAHLAYRLETDPVVRARSAELFFEREIADDEKAPGGLARSA